MSLRSLRDMASLGLRHASAFVGAATGVTERRLAGKAGEVAILMYHRILPDRMDASCIEPGMYVRASTFDTQLGWLRQRGTLATLGEALDRPVGPRDAPLFVITFDDGWRDNLTVAWPILRRHGVCPTIFLVRDWILGGGEFMTPEDVRDLATQGVEFGAHTVTHPRLDGLNEREAEAEMLRSKEAVEEWTETACRFLAYPYGAHSPSTLALAGRIFEGSVLARGGWWRLGGGGASLPRIGIHQDMSSTRWLFESRLVGDHK